MKKGVRSIAAVVGVISFGLYSGFIPTEFAELIKAVGFTKIGIDLVEKIVPTGEALSNAKKDDLYFLWQAKKLAN